MICKAGKADLMQTKKWIRIFSFSFQYFLLIPELITAVGVFVTGLAGEKAGGRKSGFFEEIFVALSSVLNFSIVPTRYVFSEVFL